MTEKTPPPLEKWRFSDQRILLGAGLFYLLLYVVFWPKAYAIIDESAYLSLAYVLRHGTVYSDLVGVTSLFELYAGPHRIVMYPPGLPALYALISLVSWKAVLGVNLVAHLMTFGLVARILRHLRLSPVYALLYLFHPTAVIYSRTVMSDIPTGLLFAASFWCFLRQRWTLAGVLTGVALLVRNASLLGGPLLMVACLLEPLLRQVQKSSGSDNRLLANAWREGFGSAVRVACGWIPFFLFAYWYQAVMQEGGWHKFPLLQPANLPQGLKAYNSFLLVAYPGMLFAPLVYAILRREGRALLCCFCYGFILLYSCYDFTDAAGGKLETFVVGQRYLLTVMPLFVIGYAAAMSELARRVRVPNRVRHLLAGGVVFVLAGVSVGIHYRHQKLLTETAQVRDVVGQVVLPGDVAFCNAAVGKLFHAGWNHVQAYKKIPETPGEVAALEDALMTNRRAWQNRRVVVAAWFRDSSAAKSGEKDAIQALQADCSTRPLLSEEAQHQLPPGVIIFQVLGPRGATAVDLGSSNRPVRQSTQGSAAGAGKTGRSVAFGLLRTSLLPAPGENL